MISEFHIIVGTYEGCVNQNETGSVCPSIWSQMQFLSTNSKNSDNFELIYALKKSKKYKIWIFMTI